MDDSRIPWWLVVLLGICVTGLALWQSSRWKLQFRCGAGALGLIYLALLVFAIGGTPRGAPPAQSRGLTDLLVISLSGLSLLFAVLLSGRPPLRGQLAWFGLFSLSNGGICFLLGAEGVGSFVTALGLFMALLLIRECRRGPRFDSSDLWPASSADLTPESAALPWLVGGTGLAVALALIGTTYYALHAESTRATQSGRYSAFPSRARVRLLLSIDPEKERSANAIESVFGHRADVAVLLGVLAFMSLAARRTVCDK